MTSVIVAGARTPMGRYLGSLSTMTAVQLGGIVIAAALERAGVAGADVDRVVMGNVVQAGNGQAPARQAAAAGGVPLSVPATTINTVCLSGIDAIVQADRLIRLGEADVVVAGGMESMSLAPHLLHARTGLGYGQATMIDALEYDGLWDARTGQSMGALTDRSNAEGEQIAREAQDAFAARSHQRAAAARDSGVFAEEIVPVEVPGRKGSVLVEHDEGIRADSTAETLAGLRPAFSPTGTVTAGSSSPLSDGAAAVVVMRRELAQERGLTWLAEIGAHGEVAGPDDSTLQHQPANAIQLALDREHAAVADLALVEINEAFAVVGLSSMAKLGLDPERVNVHGGAIALGHPLGMSGARLTLSLALSLVRTGSHLGVAALCGGSGQGTALILRR